MTREQFDWYPHRVICKRFNVPDPYPKYYNDNAYVIIMNYFSSEIVGVPAAVVPASSNKVLQFESSSVVNVVQEEEDEEKEQEEHEDHNFEEEEIEMKVSEQKKAKTKCPL